MCIFLLTDSSFPRILYARLCAGRDTWRGSRLKLGNVLDCHVWLFCKKKFGLKPWDSRRWERRWFRRELKVWESRRDKSRGVGVRYRWLPAPEGADPATELEFLRDNAHLAGETSVQGPANRKGWQIVFVKYLSNTCACPEASTTPSPGWSKISNISAGNCQNKKT